MNHPKPSTEIVEVEPRLPLVSVLAASEAAAAGIEGQQYAEIEVIAIEQTSPGGRMEALVAGIDAAGGDFVVWLPAGDTLLPGAIEVLAELLMTHEKVAVAYPSFERLDVDGTVLDVVIPE